MLSVEAAVVGAGCFFSHTDSNKKLDDFPRAVSRLILDDLSRYVQRTHNLRPASTPTIPYSIIVFVAQSLQGIRYIVNLKDKIPFYGMGDFAPNK